MFEIRKEHNWAKHKIGTENYYCERCGGIKAEGQPFPSECDPLSPAGRRIYAGLQDVGISLDRLKWDDPEKLGVLEAASPFGVYFIYDGGWELEGVLTSSADYPNDELAQEAAELDYAKRLLRLFSRERVTTLREANILRQREWDAGNQLSLTYRGNELAGEVGEACNIIKKLERERLGIVGSRASRKELAEELADVVICADLIAMAEGINLNQAVTNKFNKTSAKNGLTTRLERKTDGTEN